MNPLFAVHLSLDLLAGQVPISCLVIGNKAVSVDMAREVFKAMGVSMMIIQGVLQTGALGPQHY